MNLPIRDPRVVAALKAKAMQSGKPLMVRMAGRPMGIVVPRPPAPPPPKTGCCLKGK